MNIVATHNYVIARILRQKETTVGKHDVIVPARTLTSPCIGEVTSVGPSCRPKVSEGDTILFPPYSAGQRHTVDNLEYIVLLDWEILGVWPK